MDKDLGADLLPFCMDSNKHLQTQVAWLYMLEKLVVYFLND